MTADINFRAIGVVHTPFMDPKGTPIQSIGGRNTHGTIEVFKEYEPGLKDIGGFSHLIVLYHFHKARKSQLIQKPYLEDTLRGIFAIRSPHRPNPIGFSVVRLISVDNNIMHVTELDILEGTPVLDIKPYIPEVDCRPEAFTGWVSGKESRYYTQKAD